MAKHGVVGGGFVAAQQRAQRVLDALQHLHSVQGCVSSMKEVRKVAMAQQHARGDLDALQSVKV